ncbi:MAG: UDP-N-acetylmuramoyl-L-alanyl-D-glutamate--2,6-diaminopimelate ligase [Desulforhopalus sp.]
MSSSKAHTTVSSLLKGLNFKILNLLSGKSIDNQLVSSITADSRKAAADGLFVALPGAICDGHNFLQAAVAGGCRAIVCGTGKLTEDQAGLLQVTVIEVEDTAKAYATIAANYFGRPADKLKLIGITGTNGKTTVTYLLEQVLLQAGLAVGVIGTINNRYTGKKGEQKILQTRFTTPEAYLLQEVLREMADNGVDYVIMEVSSHALAQSRIGSILFDATAFTNLSRDHLDYHAGMENYFQAKTILFAEHMKDTGIAVLPVLQGSPEDKEWLRRLYATCTKNCRQVMRWGEAEDADIRLQEFSTILDRTDMLVETHSGQHALSTPLVGRYNVDNVLTVYGICMALRIEEALICNYLSSAAGAPGRLEKVSAGPGWDSKGPVVLVDYAHSPDALEKVLTTVAALPHGRLFCVFGCGGDRDKGKRPLMGEVVGKLCDVAIVTDDNPRTENPDGIVDEILVGIRMTALSPIEVKDDTWPLARGSKDCGYVVIRDRRKAIEAAIRAALPGDIVLIAGKGHEPYQLTLQGKRFFDDRAEAESVLFCWTAELVSAAVKGKLHLGHNQAGLLGSIVTDSRVVSSDGIFVALKGENHDAHDFAEKAVENGARCLVVERIISLPPEMAVCQIEVKDTLQALGDLAAFRRKALAAQREQVVIGLTGSCGKTTVKEMVSSILAGMWPEGPDFPADCVLKTRGNFNNLIGLPLSLLPLDVKHRAAVLEMGMNRSGELKRLGEIADPDISCITNIHGAHLEGLESIEGVARAKEELFAATRTSGVLIVNLDDSRIRDLSTRYNNRKITFSINDAGRQKPDEGMRPDLWASNIHMEEGGVITFTLHHDQGSVEIHLFIAGEHNVSNALCAAAIGLAAGASIEQIASGLADFRPPDKRMEMLQAKSGFTIINDTYNANPGSMAAGLKTLKMIAGKSSVAVIGDMLELGPVSGQAHYEIGKLIAELAIDYVGVVGEFKKNVVQGALDHGFHKDRLHMFEGKEVAARWIHEMVDCEKLAQNDVVLVKASRGLRFETIVAELVDF